MDGYWFSADTELPTHPLEPLDPVPPPPADPAQPPVGLGVLHYCYSPLKPGTNGLHFTTTLTAAMQLGNFGPICWSVSLPDQFILNTIPNATAATWGSANQRRYMVRKDFLQPMIDVLQDLEPYLDPTNRFHRRAIEELALAIGYLAVPDRINAWKHAHQALVDCMASDTRRIIPRTDAIAIEAALQAAWTAAP